ncbi:MAG: hypothetical protein JRI23_13340 [Deltaproteobacteria bacterium]|jgi:hypothetical protein|nr:hypothetical protein [Deltaproteobacteria bacterium]MBW2532708.1 hypothetical protein [Deltaproteobacteria bacterium]
MPSMGKYERNVAAFVLGCAVLLAALVGGCRRFTAKPTGPTYFDDVAPVAKALSKKLGKGDEICRILVYQRKARLVYQGALGKMKAFELDQRISSTRPRSPSGCIAEPVRPLSEALFAWSSVDLSLVPKMATEAAKWLGLGSAADISHLLLERPGDVKNGPARWRAHPNGGLGWVNFDLRGKVIAGVTRHGKSIDGHGEIDYFKDPSAIPKFIEKHLGKDFQLAEVQIWRTYFHFEGRPNRPGAKLERYMVIKGELGSPGRGAWHFKDPNDILFPQSDLDWSLVPKMIAAARKRFGDPAAHIRQIDVSQGIHRKPLTWTVHLDDRAFFVFDGKGTLTEAKNLD